MKGPIQNQKKIKAKSAENYTHGKKTLSEAARRAGVTLWDMKSYLIARGFKSQYTVEELMEEAAALAKKK